MERIKTSVLIIGAGPAGCMTSYGLSNNSIDHILIDKDVFPRDKICGDALSGKVLDALAETRPEFLNEFIARKDVFTPSPGISFFGPNGKQLNIPFPKRKDKLDVGYVATRKNFDNLLLEYLDANFCTFYQGVSLKKLEDRSALLQIGEKQIQVDFDLIIGADGARSKVHEHFIGRITDKFHHSAAIRAYYKGVTGFNSDYIELHFIKDLLPGYFWIFPLPNGEANVGLGMLSAEISKNKVSLRAKLDEIVANHPVMKERFKNAELLENVKGWGLPLGSKKRTIAGNHFLLTGDAAWLIDPFTGEGIGNALVSGQLASKWATKALNEKNFSADLLKGYQEEVYHKLWTELNLSHKLQKLSAKKWLFNFLINKALSNKKLRETMTSMFANIDLRSELKKPSFYIKLLFGN
ncbi:MAG: geranylgeranyl reductase family protein [Bacteroidia bacterium]